MIRINGPANAQYQCSCPGVASPIPVIPGGTGTGVTAAPGLPILNDGPTIGTNPYPATGVTNGTSAGCFCLDGANPNLGCGCSCDCFSLTVTIPTGVCVCPQDDTGRVITPTLPAVPSTPAYTNPVFAVTQTPAQPGQQTFPPITAGPTTPVGGSTLPVIYPTTAAVQQSTQTVQPLQPILTTQTPLQPLITTVTPVVQPGQPGVTPARDATTTLPLTTTCIMYPVSATVTASQCTCMPQYEQCAQNVCCLSTRFRSHKNDIIRAAADATGVQESTLDIFVDIFNKIKNRFSATA
ncbi:hypothetical protein PFISCL1PPCAC_29027 [Pristionchus fissidentatus]|uniref:Uncharacterized protein n=1 Tax=Pristionchus fissidentatus TaxID=1538716 RepID=A0AAV5WZT6_9BILA|nr:hypothetical protein PFISCL1PPCAC_29027 [Pristionchus fissidentatus]